MLQPVAEILTPAWLPPRDQFLERPIKKAVIIDPKYPVEVDDAISAELLPDGDARIEIHIADIGLIADQTIAIDDAREKGWSSYSPGMPADTIFPPEIYLPLGLDNRRRRVGAPAMSVGFTIDLGSGKYGDVTIQRTRIRGEQYTHRSFANQAGSIDRGGERARTVSGIGQQLLTLTGNSPSAPEAPSNTVKRIVQSYLTMGNIILAREAYRLKLPWLFRNHGRAAVEGSSVLTPEERELFGGLMKAVFDYRPLGHDAQKLDMYCFATSPLRRFPDTANGLNLDAFLRGAKLPFDEPDMQEISREMIAKYREEIRSKALSRLVKAA